MVELTKKTETPTILLLLAGLIMVVTLWKSKKAQTVTKTEDKPWSPRRRNRKI